MKRFVGALAALVCFIAPAIAVETKTFEQSDQADFDRGTLTKLSLSSDGRLMPAPVVKDIYDAQTTFLWAVVRDSKGNLFAGGGGVGGSKAKLIQVDPAGRAKTLAELDGMQIQALAIDKQDRLYAATTPDGKIYRVGADGKAEVFYDPKTKYIWAMAFSKAGDLFVATGEDGEIHRVTPNGTGSVFYRTEEAHVRSLAIDANDNLIAGTDPSGLILRISPSGQGFVLYEAPKREITALQVAPDGNIYAGGSGIKQPAAAPANPANAGGRGGAVMPAGPQGAPRPTIAPVPMGGGGAAAGNAGVPGGSEIYRIQPDGYARKIWTHAQDLVYALALDSSNHVIAGTGNKGNVYRIDNDHQYTRLLNLAPAQVTGFASAPDGRLYAVTGNIGEIYSIGPEREPSGTFESEVLDAGGFSYWGRIATLSHAQGSVTIETRSGNVSRTQKDWSPWSKLDGASRVASPAARFLQYKATVSGSAELYDVTAAYEMKNVAPVVEQVEITPANYKFPAPSAAPASASSSPATLTLPPLGRRAAAPSTATDTGNSPSMTYAKGQIGARWLANDENGDTLVFKVEVRGENETAWKLLRDNIRERYYSWDSTAFPDGKYFLRVTASDAPSNPPDQVLTSSRESDRFLIDNSPPEISGLAGVANGARIDVSFHAKDAWNVLDQAQYSVNGGEWKVVEPTTRLSDSQEHDYRFQVDRAGETTIAVKVTDDYENEAVAKTVVK